MTVGELLNLYYVSSPDDQRSLAAELFNRLQRAYEGDCSPKRLQHQHR